MERTIKLEEGWLHLPIGRFADRYYVTVEVDGKKLTELYLGLSPSTPDFWCGMDLEKYQGRTVTLSVRDTEELPPDGFLDGIVNGAPMNADHPYYADLYREKLRPHYHFTSRRGWMNDPNGLVYQDGTYHLYYQHNPYGTAHGGVNVCWGHATSQDGVHWTEHSDAIRTWTRRCHIASGSCIVDYEGVAGYGKGAIIAAFTHLASRRRELSPDPNPPFGCFSNPPSEGQFLAYSTDGGMNFTLFSEQAVIPTENGKDWRDPRLYYEPDGGFGIAVSETNEKGSCVTFYHSDDLHHWERVSQADNLHECPDLFRLTPVNGGDPKWVLYGADSLLRVGEYAASQFTQEGDMYPLDYGLSTYAGQTWSGRDDTDGRMHISWLRDARLCWDRPDAYPDMPFSQQMTVPCLLKLVNTPNGYRVTRTPIPALDTLHDGEPETIRVQPCTQVSIPLRTVGDTYLNVTCNGPLTVELGNCTFVYDPTSGETIFNGGRKCAVLQQTGALSLRILTDVLSSELFLQSEISATYGQEMEGKQLVLRCEEGLSVEGCTYAMKCIWDDNR